MHKTPQNHGARSSFLATFSLPCFWFLSRGCGSYWLNVWHHSGLDSCGDGGCCLRLRIVAVQPAYHDGCYASGGQQDEEAGDLGDFPVDCSDPDSDEFQEPLPAAAWGPRAGPRLRRLPPFLFQKFMQSWPADGESARIIKAQGLASVCQHNNDWRLPDIPFGGDVCDINVVDPSPADVGEIVRFDRNVVRGVKLLVNVGRDSIGGAASSG